MHAQYTLGAYCKHIKTKAFLDAFQYLVHTLHELTDIHNINFYRFRIGFSQRIRGHHCDVVYDPNRRMSLIKITGIVSRLMIIRTFKDFQRSEKVLDSLKVTCWLTFWQQMNQNLWFLLIESVNMNSLTILGSVCLLITVCCVQITQIFRK